MHTGDHLPDHKVATSSNAVLASACGRRKWVLHGRAWQLTVLPQHMLTVAANRLAAQEGMCRIDSKRVGVILNNKTEVLLDFVVTRAREDIIAGCREGLEITSIMRNTRYSVCFLNCQPGGFFFIASLGGGGVLSNSLKGSP